MKLTKIYTQIMEGVGLKVDDEFTVTTLEGDVITLGLNGDKKKLSIVDSKATSKPEPGDVVRFHPLGESIFEPPSPVNRFFVAQMKIDLTIRLILLMDKLAELALDKKKGGDLTTKQVALLSGVSLNNSGLTYYKRVRAHVVESGELLSITNKRSFKVNDETHSRVCVVESAKLDYSKENGLFDIEPNSKTSFEAVLALFKNVLPKIDVQAVSNIKSSPTFISMLHALRHYSSAVNEMAGIAWRTGNSPVHRNVAWANEIDSLPKLYQTELPVPYPGNVNSGEPVVKQEEPKEETPSVEEPSTADDILPQSATEETTPADTVEVNTEVSGEELLPVSVTTETAVVKTEKTDTQNQTQNKESTMSTPRFQLGAGSQAQPQNNDQSLDSILNQNNQQPQQNNQQTVFQNNQAQQQNNGMQNHRIITDVDAKAADAENIAHLKATNADPAARETATTCHAIDIHGQPLFRLDGTAYIIKGTQPKINMIHRSDANGCWLFKQNGDPVLGPLTYNGDGTPAGLRNVGRVGQNRNQQQQQNNTLFNNQQNNSNSNSLAARLNNSQGDVLFGNNNNQSIFQQQRLTDNQIRELQRRGIPNENIKRFMETGDRSCLTTTSINSGGSIFGNTGGLSDSDKNKCLQALVALVRANAVQDNQALKIKQMIDSNQITIDQAKELVQKAASLQQQQSNSIFNDSMGGTGPSLL